MRVMHLGPVRQAAPRERVQRRRASWLACLVVLAAALLACVLPQVASAESGLSSGLGASTELGASAEPEEISLTPSTTKPYYACPHEGCAAINEPPSIKTATGYALPDGTPLVGGGPNGGYTAEELESAYNIPKTGGKEPEQQIVAVIDAHGDTTANQDLKKYREQYKLSACTEENKCFRKVNQKGEEGNYPESGFEGWGTETSLDLDMVSAACPECHIVLVEANNEEESEMGAATNKAVELGATEISSSYIFPETYKTRCGEADCTQYSSDYNHPEYDGHPVVITVAAGDYGYNNHLYPELLTKDAPTFPASTPTVIAVGGTELNIEKNARTSEKVWPETGSGCSASESKTNTWQKETEEKEGRKGCTSNRTDNDVAADASCKTPVSFYSTPEFGGWWYECGTSVSSPFVAGIEAHANAYTRALGAKAFYNKPSMLFHVSEGSDGECGTESESTYYLCHATKEGYNGPTGMGTPDGVFEVTGAPLATTGSATGITETGGTLHGTVNSGGLETKYYFEYGTTESYGSKTAEASAGSGTSNVEESKAVTGLTVGKTYDFRIVATNSEGTTRGKNQTFRPSGKPTVETGTATNASETKVTLNGVVNPKGVETKYYFEYGTTESYGRKTAEESAGSGGSNVEESKIVTGLAAGTKYHFRIVAVNEHGTSDGADQVFVTAPFVWSLQTTLNPEESVSEFYGVSCASWTVCTAVGSHYVVIEYSNLSLLAEYWNGREWSVQATPNPVKPGAAGEWSQLLEISCPSSTACTAVGSYLKENTVSPLAERWNGVEWTIQSTPSTGAKYTRLQAVSCSSTSACTAAGFHEGVSEPAVTLVDRWNGTEWKIQATPNPEGAKGSVLEGVSCASSTVCTAAGYYKNSSGTRVTLAEEWNGTEWKVQTTPNPTGAKESLLKGVSCISSTACTADGYYENSSGTTVTLAEAWNGSEWKVQTTPNPEGAKESILRGVSCASSTACTAAGSYENSSGTRVTLAEEWNGTEWKVQSTPNREKYSNYLYGVSCSSSSMCTAAGFAGGGTLAERYE